MRYALLSIFLMASSVYAEQRVVLAQPRSVEVTGGQSAALAFAPAVSISRDDRQLSAFVGYDSQTVVAFSLYYEDNQTDFLPLGCRTGRFGSFDNNFIDRRATVEITGVRFR